MDYKIIFGVIAVTIQLASYVYYLHGIYKGWIKPHGFTWFAWGTLTAIGFAAQTISHAGAGSWVMLANAVMCYSIAGVAFYQGHIKYVLFDWLALFGALIGGVLWWWTSNPLFAVILISVSDGVALLPTVRKAYTRPNEESVGPWLVGIFTYIFSIMALESFIVTNWLYPAAIILFDTFFVLEVLIRRRQINLVKYNHS